MRLLKRKKKRLHKHSNIAKGSIIVNYVADPSRCDTDDLILELSLRGYKVVPLEQESGYKARFDTLEDEFKDIGPEWYE